MQLPRKPAPSGSRGNTRPQIWTAAFAVLVLALVLMACGYHVGTASAVALFKQKETKLLMELTNLRAAEAPCDEQRNAMLNEFGTRVSSSLKRRYDIAKGAYMDVQSELEILRQDARRCSAERANLEEGDGHGMAMDLAQRDRLHMQRRETYAGYKRLHNITNGEGPAVIALTQDVYALHHTYVQACTNVSGCVVVPLAFEAGRTADSATPFDKAYAAALLPLDFGPGFGNLTDIYMAPASAEEEAERVGPTYFNRTDDTEALMGRRRSTRAPVSLPLGLMAQYYKLVDAAFCAYSLRNADVQVENLFQYDRLTELDGVLLPPPGASRASEKAVVLSRLHDLFATPLVRFCEGCETDEWTGLCASHDTALARHYGRRRYWAARSMVRASPDIRAAAHRFWQVRETTAVLAVVAQLQPMYTAECLTATANASRGTHYAYLRQIYPSNNVALDHSPVLSGMGRSRFAECSTSAFDLVSAMVKVAEASTPVPSAIYLDAPRTLALDVLMVLDQQSSPWASKIIQRPDPSSAGAAADELLSHEIASRATHLLVSPYLPTSRFVVENYLLRNNFSTSSSVWYL